MKQSFTIFNVCFQLSSIYLGGKRLLVSQTLDTRRIQYITRFKTTISNNFTTTAPKYLTWKFLARSLRNFHLLSTENIQRSMSYFGEYLQNNMYKKTIVNFVEYIKSSLKNIQQNNIINIMNYECVTFKLPLHSCNEISTTINYQDKQHRRSNLFSSFNLCLCYD